MISKIAPISSAGISIIDSFEFRSNLTNEELISIFLTIYLVVLLEVPNELRNHQLGKTRMQHSQIACFRLVITPTASKIFALFWEWEYGIFFQIIQRIFLKTDFSIVIFSSFYQEGHINIFFLLSFSLF